MYDYLAVATPDYNATLSVTPQRTMLEDGGKNQKINIGDDGSEERISLADASIFYVTLQWAVISEANAGTIVDFYHDTAKGNGMVRSFKWTHPTDGHTYVVRFASKLPRLLTAGHAFSKIDIRLKVLGYIAD